MLSFFLIMEYKQRTLRHGRAAGSMWLLPCRTCQGSGTGKPIPTREPFPGINQRSRLMFLRITNKFQPRKEAK